MHATNLRIVCISMPVWKPPTNCLRRADGPNKIMQDPQRPQQRRSGSSMHSKKRSRVRLEDPNNSLRIAWRFQNTFSGSPGDSTKLLHVSQTRCKPQAQWRKHGSMLGSIDIETPKKQKNEARQSILLQHSAPFALA